MTNIKQISLMFFLLSSYSFGDVRATTYYPCSWDETEQCHDPEPPPENALKLKQKVFKDPNDKEDDIPYTLHRPEAWSIRSFYTGNNFVYEFDEQGNVLTAEGKKATGYMVEKYKGDEPAWKGNGHVYYWYNPESASPEPNLMIILVSDKACLAMPVGGEYSFIKKIKKMPLFI